MKTKLEQFIKQNPHSYFLMLKKNKSYKNLYDYIYANTYQLVDTNDFVYSLQTRIYWILNDLKDFPICPICGKQYGLKTNITLKYGYSPTCASKVCRYTNALNRAQQTNIDRYGCKCSLSNKDVYEKSKKTWEKNYGVDHPMKCKKIKDKVVNTCISTYGVTNYTKTDEYVKKTKITKKEKYGNENYVNPEKAKNTKQEKYGDSTYNNSKQAKNTCIQKYGVDNFSKTNDFKIQLKSRRRKKFIQSILSNSYVDILDKIDDNTDLSKPINCRCKKCKNTFFAILNYNSLYRNGIAFVCKKCFPRLNGTSSQEKELQNFIKSLAPDAKFNAKSIISPYELDIYVPSKKIAIEFDGLYWHSDNKKNDNKMYHLMKTNLCEDKKIQLIHIFENEWLCKKNIVKSRLKNLFGLYDKVIYARKCSIKEINVKLSMKFQNENHLQGSIGANIHLGLFFNDELIALMTFGKPRFNKKYEWELLRFCTKLNYHIPGAAGKLLMYFENKFNPRSLISYADRRWSQGKLYKTLGFKLNSITSPNYWYWKALNGNQYIFENRIKYQKHKLQNILKDYDPSLSERENMLNNKFNVIYDCGNFVFVKTF